MSLNAIGNAVHYGDQSLIFRLKTLTPANFHRGIIRGIQVSMKMSLLAEDLTKEEKDSLNALIEFLTQMTPNEAHFEQAYKMQETPAPSLS